MGDAAVNNLRGAVKPNILGFAPHGCAPNILIWLHMVGQWFYYTTGIK